jgi:hypothetical protein
MSRRMPCQKIQAREPYLRLRRMNSLANSLAGSNGYRFILKVGGSIPSSSSILHDLEKSDK